MGMKMEMETLLGKLKSEMSFEMQLKLRNRVENVKQIGYRTAAVQTQQLAWDCVGKCPEQIKELYEVLRYINGHLKDKTISADIKDLYQEIP